MKCLHICNDFYSSKVHSSLYKELDDLNVDQVIYNPIKKGVNLNNNSIILNNKNSSILYSKPLKKYHRVLFRSKISFLKKDILSKKDISDVSCIHATTLFSDGALAYELSVKYDIPFIAAVRATDLTMFLKYRKDLHRKCNQIINRASKIIFISDNLKEKFLSHPLIKKNKKNIEHKCIVIYNGIDDFWLNNRVVKNDIKPVSAKIVYVGSLISRKNVVNLANAVLELNKKGIKCSLNIIGDGGSDKPKVIEISNANPNVIKYLGAIKDKQKLALEYSTSHIFCMPSRNETFGLVYIEALSQGLPILYSKNDGIDGIFEINIGEKCNSNNLNDIILSLEKLVKNYINYEINEINFSAFDWREIATKYSKIYNSIQKI